MTEPTTDTTAENTPQDVENAPQHAADTTEVPQDQAVTPEAAEEPQEDADERQPRTAEARKYRLRLRETEQQRDALTAQLAALQDSTLTEALSGDIRIPSVKHKGVEQVVKLHNAADLFALGGIDKATFFDESGALDTGALKKAVSTLHETRPELFAPLHRPVPTAGMTPSNNSPIRGDFTEAFRPRDSRGRG